MKWLSFGVPETDEAKANHDPYHQFRTMDGKLTPEGELLVDIAIGLLSDVCFRNSHAHGWYDKYTRADLTVTDGRGNFAPGSLLQRNFGEVMMLINSEVAEAFEAYRDGDDQMRIKYSYKDENGKEFFTEESEMHWGDGTLGKPEGITAELADVLIRVFDYAGAYGIPLSEATIRKHAYNYTRPYRHGGKLA